MKLPMPLSCCCSRFWNTHKWENYFTSCQYIFSLIHVSPCLLSSTRAAKHATVCECTLYKSLSQAHSLSHTHMQTQNRPPHTITLNLCSLFPGSDKFDYHGAGKQRCWACSAPVFCVATLFFGFSECERGERAAQITFCHPGKQTTRQWGDVYVELYIYIFYAQLWVEPRAGMQSIVAIDSLKLVLPATIFTYANFHGTKKENYCSAGLWNDWWIEWFLRQHKWLPTFHSKGSESDKSLQGVYKRVSWLHFNNQ